jgi:hypothetical protein
MIDVDDRGRREGPRRVEPTGVSGSFVRRRPWVLPLVMAVAVLTGMTTGTVRAETEGKPAPRGEPATAKATDAIDCQLPGQIRPLGRQATYVARGQTIRTTSLHCAQRGGQIVSEGQDEPAQK